MKLEIVAATLVTGRGADELFLFTTLPMGTWPYEGEAYVRMEVAKGRGKAYAETWFEDVPLTIIDKDKGRIQ
jgi:hypothetical protein